MRLSMIAATLLGFVADCSDTASFFIAISRAVVNHVDGDGTAPDPLVWSAGALRERRRVVHAVRDRAFLPGPVGMWEGERIALGSASVTADDVEVWPYSVRLLVNGYFLRDIALQCGWSRPWEWWHILFGGFSFCMSSPISEAWTPNFSVGCSVWSRH